MYLTFMVTEKGNCNSFSISDTITYPLEVFNNVC